jgi:PAS domain S-box-containing protein
MPVSPQLLVDQSPDAIIFAGTDGLIATWNPAAERIFGHAADAALGQSLDMIIPEQFRAAHWKGYDAALESKATKYAGKALATRAVRADGATIYVELSFAVIQDESGTVLGALAHARDITERFEADRETRRRLRELEAAAKP